MTGSALPLTRALLAGALLLLACTPTGLADEPADLPPTTAGHWEDVKQAAEDEAERFREEAHAYASALVRNVRECLLEENPHCGVWPLLP